MADMSDFFKNARKVIGAVLLFVAATTTGAVAQNVVVIVNGEPITALDIEQRIKFTQMSTQKAPARQDVINELIDEKLKVREGKRWGIEISEADIETMYATMTGRMRLTVEQMNQNLTKGGASPNTVKSRIRAEQVWSQLVRSRYQSSMQISDKEVQSAIEASKPEEADTVAYDYIMRPILFLVAPGSPPTVFEARRKEADALRGRFKGCEEGVAYARTLRDLAVRPQVIRSSGDLAAELRKMLDAVPLGQLTAPEVTKLGIEMFAVCSKQPSKADTPSKRQARDAVFSQRFERQSKQYLNKLRREALIEHR
jgi:peptidyl-prolyl cis-trans isomerase SurA